jgi:hypothetical protein
MIEIKNDPTARDVRIFGLLWLLFFGGLGAVAWWKPQGLIGAAIFLGAAWLISLIFNRENRRLQLLGVLIPLLLGSTGFAVQSGFGLNRVLILLGAVGLLGALAIWLVPALGRRLYVGWMLAAAPVGWTISHLVLGAVFFLVLFPIGLVMRLAGRDPMHRKFDRNARSYWIRRDGRPEPARYFRQF